MRRQAKIVASAALVFVAVLIVGGAGMSLRPGANSNTTQESIPNAMSNDSAQVAPPPKVSQSDAGVIVAGNQTALPQASQVPSTSNPNISPEPSSIPQAGSSSSQSNQTSSGSAQSPIVSPEPTPSPDKDSNSKPSKSNDNENKK